MVEFYFRRELKERHVTKSHFFSLLYITDDLYLVQSTTLLIVCLKDVNCKIVPTHVPTRYLLFLLCLLSTAQTEILVMWPHHVICSCALVRWPFSLCFNTIFVLHSYEWIVADVTAAREIWNFVNVRKKYKGLKLPKLQLLLIYSSWKDYFFYTKCKLDEGVTSCSSC